MEEVPLIDVTQVIQRHNTESLLKCGMIHNTASWSTLNNLYVVWPVYLSFRDGYCSQTLGMALIHFFFYIPGLLESCIICYQGDTVV